MYYLIALAVLCVCLILVFFRFVYNKNSFEKLQAINTFNSLAIIFIVVYCFYIDRAEYLDLAIIYAVLSYLSLIVIGKYIRINNEENHKHTNEQK